MTSTTSTTAKKTDAKKGFGAGFNAFRDRAMSVADIDENINVTPYLLTEEDGFSREFALEKPSLKERIFIEDALSKGDTIRLLRLVFKGDADDILADLETYENESGVSSMPVLVGIVIEYLEHFYGPGAGDKSFSNLSI